MPRLEVNSSRPIRIAVFYTICTVLLAFLLFLAVGRRTILEHASSNKPYALLFSDYAFADLTDRSPSAKIICFGDSNYIFPPHKYARPSEFGKYFPGLIYEAVRSEWAQENLVVSDWSFVGAKMFDYYCLYHEALNYSPRLIIVPITWRTFSQIWIDVGSQFPELSVFVPFRSEFPQGYVDPLRSRGISVVEQREYVLNQYWLYPVGTRSWARRRVRGILEAPSEFEIPPGLLLDELRTFRAEEARKEEQGSAQVAEISPGEIIRAWFPMSIRESNPVFQDLRALVYVASRHEPQVVFFIWPLNQEYFGSLGVLDKPALQESIRLFEKAAVGPNIHFVDLSDLLGPEYFVDIMGHCTVEGRRKVAEALAPEIQSILNQAPNPSSASGRSDHGA